MNDYDDTIPVDEEKEFELAAEENLGEGQAFNPPMSDAPLRPFPPRPEDAEWILERLKDWRAHCNRTSAYLGLPDWQYIGSLFGLYSSTKLMPESNERFFVAVGILSRRGGSIEGIGVAFAEETINGRKIYSTGACGLAQTRALSRAYSNMFRWIAVQGGFEQTPAEEMDAVNSQENLVIPPEIPAQEQKPAAPAILKYQSGQGITNQGSPRASYSNKPTPEVAWQELLDLANKYQVNDDFWLEISNYKGIGKSYSDCVKYFNTCRAKNWKMEWVYVWLKKAKTILGVN